MSKGKKVVWPNSIITLSKEVVNSVLQFVDANEETSEEFSEYAKEWIISDYVNNHGKGLRAFQNVNAFPLPDKSYLSLFKQIQFYANYKNAEGQDISAMAQKENIPTQIINAYFNHYKTIDTQVRERILSTPNVNTKHMLLMIEPERVDYSESPKHKSDAMKRVLSIILSIEDKENSYKNGNSHFFPSKPNKKTNSVNPSESFSYKPTAFVLR